MKNPSGAEQTLCWSKCVSGSTKLLEGKQEVGGVTQQGAEVSMIQHRRKIETAKPAEAAQKEGGWCWWRCAPASSRKQSSEVSASPASNTEEVLGTEMPFLTRKSRG